ncbi:right-handed parallel beta-helix repeat-containing protein [Paenibacillus sp. HB172176]|uniref:right-handed parallel beta-helix repeat-containing protein n=1 Tax=Paenibacillus sp. HB172176 TaxID=2493690 RepID=UPI00143BF487|nr:right-handed parallel beta-helix repeat-containing protein [Paenibacillus sp. HB172176]
MNSGITNNGNRRSGTTRSSTRRISTRRTMTPRKGTTFVSCLLVFVLTILIALPIQVLAAAPPTGKARLSFGSTPYYAELTSTADWSNVNNYSYDDTQGGSVWEITSLGSGKYKIESAGGALTLNSSTDWQPVKTAAYSGWTTQQWTITDLGSGKFKLECNGKALTGDNAGNGSTVKSAAYSSYTTQQWSIASVDTSSWPAGTWDWVYQNVDKSSRLEVADRENILIIGTTIHDVINDMGMYIARSSNVRIEDTIVEDVTDSGSYGMAVYLYRSDEIIMNESIIREQVWMGTTEHAHALHIYAGSDITIEHSDIYNVDGNGITIEAENDNIVIDDNDIYNTGSRPYSASAPYHGIYSKAPDVLIENNRIHDSLDGSAISMRSTGVVQGNTLYNNKHASIAYWPDYAKGSSNALTIEDNTIWQDNYTTSNSKASGISINYTTGKPAENYFDNFYLTGNDLTISDGNSYGVITCFEATGTWSIANVQVTDNTITDLRSSTNYLDGETLMNVISGNVYQ